MRLLALDPSGVFGWAHGDASNPEGQIFSGTFKLPNDRPSKKMVALERWLVGIIRENEIQSVLIEEPFLGQRQSFQSIVSLTGFVTVAGLAAAKCDCNCVTVAISTWRSGLGLPTRGPSKILSEPHYAAKFGHRKNGLSEARRQYVKDRAIEYVRKRGSDPADDNEADAIAMFLWKRMRLEEERLQTSTKSDLFADLEI